MTLMRFDPFRELDRWTEQALAGSRNLRTMPMEALRRGHRFLVALDLPGVTQDDIDVTVERNVLTVRARRAPLAQEGDDVIVDERPHGEFSRQLFLGENLDATKLTADLTDGVLNLEIPVSEASKPRKISLSDRPVTTAAAGQ
ncbi:Hsp20/alpha crystallin family protein [Georgenia muralis]|uniref:HSP20 family protein n=1 Tax=Georgenia muralis TaxID=154117 RepID=A0A3N4Z9G8_9MICO|nr:Hsp20/alpha crystallin family protein [Georgenia muralis]RPF28546.1 HSP20 family protein [Georgenia muralis]